MATCIRCGEFFLDERQEMGFYRCIPCNTQYAKARGDEIKMQSVPLNKSNYFYISDMEMVKQLNPKRTT
jgi:predicted  nucleic acid-binding Zn-ribbon protein